MVTCADFENRVIATLVFRTVSLHYVGKRFSNQIRQKCARSVVTSTAARCLVAVQRLRVDGAAVRRCLFLVVQNVRCVEYVRVQIGG